MVKIRKPLILKLNKLGPRAHLPRLFMLGQNDQNVIVTAIELMPSGGCFNMPKASQETLGEAYGMLDARKLTMAGFGICTMKSHVDMSVNEWYDRINYSLSNFRKKNILWVRFNSTIDAMYEEENGDYFIPLIQELL